MSSSRVASGIFLAFAAALAGWLLSCSGPGGGSSVADDDAADDDSSVLVCDPTEGNWRAWVMAPGSDNVYPVRATRLDAAGAAHDLDAAALRPGGAAVALQGGSLILDFGQNVAGFVELGAADAAAFSATLRFSESAEFLFDTTLRPYEIFAQIGMPFVWLPAYHRLALDGAQNWRDSQAVGAFRYVRLEVAGGAANLDYFRVRFNARRTTPAAMDGYFLSDDAELNRIWYASLYTLDLSTIPSDAGGSEERLTIGDGPWSIADGGKRDRLIWGGDLYVAGGVDFAARRDHGAAIASLDYLGARQRGDGRLPACSPAGMVGLNAFQFLQYDFFWILTAWDQYQYTGDAAALARRYAIAQKALAFAASQVRDGLLQATAGDDGSWQWTIDQPGARTFDNLLYQFSLQRAAAMAEALGRPADAAAHRAAAVQLAQAINATLWDDARGVYAASAADRVHVPLDANAMAIVAEVAGDRASRIFAYLEAHLAGPYGYVNVDPAYAQTTDGLDFHNRQSIGFVNAFAAQALFAAGRPAAALHLIRACFGYMARTDPASTMWEFIGPGGKPEMSYVSLAHAWSAGAATLLTREVLGIRPLTPGFAKFEIRPQLGGLRRVEGRSPTPHGSVFVKMQVVSEGLLVDAEAPAGETGVFVMPAEYSSWRALSGSVAPQGDGRLAFGGRVCLLVAK